MTHRIKLYSHSQATATANTLKTAGFSEAMEAAAQAAPQPTESQTMKTDATTHAEQQAAAQYESIVSMLDALDVDYDRLEELKDERQELAEAVTDTAEHAETNPAAAMDAAFELAEWDKDNADELEELAAAAGECTDEDEARDRINEDPLEVQVRSDWANPGEELTPGEFMILLCTGGPAVRIVGELDEHGEPCRAWLEYQDWGTPWTHYWGATSSTLCRYASHFFGG